MTKTPKTAEKKKHICSTCNQELEPVFDTVAKKVTGHLWRCSCWPKDWILSIG